MVVFLQAVIFPDHTDTKVRHQPVVKLKGAVRASTDFMLQDSPDTTVDMKVSCANGFFSNES